MADKMGESIGLNETETNSIFADHPLQICQIKDLQQPLQICSIKDRNFDHNKIT
jgi:hypothetical protein